MARRNITFRRDTNYIQVSRFLHSGTTPSTFRHDTIHIQAWDQLYPGILQFLQFTPHVKVGTVVPTQISEICRLKSTQDNDQPRRFQVCPGVCRITIQTFPPRYARGFRSLRSRPAYGLQWPTGSKAYGLQSLRAPMAYGLQSLRAPMAYGLQSLRAPKAYGLHCALPAAGSVSSRGSSLRPCRRPPLGAFGAVRRARFASCVWVLSHSAGARALG